MPPPPCEEAGVVGGWPPAARRRQGVAAGDTTGGRSLVEAVDHRRGRDLSTIGSLHVAIDDSAGIAGSSSRSCAASRPSRSPPSRRCSATSGRARLRGRMNSARRAHPLSDPLATRRGGGGAQWSKAVVRAVSCGPLSVGDIKSRAGDAEMSLVVPTFISLDDPRRLAELRHLAILDTPPESEYDDRRCWPLPSAGVPWGL